MPLRQGEHISNLAIAVIQNLRDQHDWTSVAIQSVSNEKSRPLIQGLPPHRLYLHPDDQIAALNQQRLGLETGKQTYREPEIEWVLPLHLDEKWSLADFAAIFDSIQPVGPRNKRIVLAILHNDSTVVYYLMHEGMVKPRQN